MIPSLLQFTLLATLSIVLSAQEPTSPEIIDPGEGPELLWPGSARPPLQPEPFREQLEAMWMPRLHLKGPHLIRMDVPQGFTVSQQNPRYSVEFIYRQSAQLSFGLSLFRPGELMETVNRETMRSYMRGLLTTAENAGNIKIDLLEEPASPDSRVRFFCLGKKPYEIVYRITDLVTGETSMRLEGWFVHEDYIYCLTYENSENTFNRFIPRVRQLLSSMSFEE